MEKTINMTNGSPYRLLINFALPLIVGNICQQIYSVADSTVVGRLIGVNAFAAIGATSLLYWTVFSIMLGFVHGFGILFAQRFGAQDTAGLRKAFAMSVILTVSVAALLTAASLLLTRPLLTILNTPADILDGAALYLYFMFGGISLTFAYNLLGALMRAMGNSKTPLFAVLISSILNIALDILFVAAFHLGIAGVAIATLIAQLFAFSYCLIVLLKIKSVHPQPIDWKVDRKTIKNLLRFSLPLAFRDSIISIGGLAVQYVINGYGTLFVAGMSAPQKFYGIMEIVGGGLEGATATFVGQNYGAKLLKRVREGVNTARRISLISAVCIAAVFLVFGRSLLGLFFANSTELTALLDIGYSHLAAMAVALPALYLLFIHQATIAGMGNTMIPMLSGFTELVLRILAVLVLPVFFAEWGVYVAESVGWIGASLLLYVAYVVLSKRLLADRLLPDCAMR